MPALASSSGSVALSRAATGASLRASAAWMSAGMAVYSACQWGMVAVLARYGTVEMVGSYALGVATSTPILMLAQLNLRAVLTTDTTGAHDFRDYRDLRLAALSLAVLAIAGLAVFTGDAAVILLVGLAQAVEWISDTYQGLLQREERHRLAAGSLILRGVLSLAALTGAVLLTGSLTLGLTAVLAVRLAVLIAYDATFAVPGLISSAPRDFDASLRSQAVLLRTALPLGVVMVLGSFTANVPRYFIANHLGHYELGIFSALASLGTAGSLFVNAFGQAVTPRMARLFAAGNTAGFRKLTAMLLAAGATLGLAAVAVAALAGEPILTLVYGPGYAREAGLLVWIMAACGAGFLASLLGYAITAARQFREQIPLQVAVLAASAFAAWLLLPAWGLKGAAAALAAGSLVQVAGEAIILAKAMPAGRWS